MFKKIGAFMVALAALLAFTPGIAQASTIYGCNDQQLCLYNDTNYVTGNGILRLGYTTLNSAPGRCYSLSGIPYPNSGASANNSAGSVIANFPNIGPPSNVLQLFDTTNCSGSGSTVVVNVSAGNSPKLYPNLGNQSFNNKVSSIKWGL